MHAQGAALTAGVRPDNGPDSTESVGFRQR